MQQVTIDRNKYIGGSDIPIIMGISKFKKRFDLLLEKAELKENDFTGNAYTEYGNVMEEKLEITLTKKTFAKDFKEDKKIVDDIRCHVDGFNGEVVLEIKTTSEIHDNVDDYIVYLVQLLFYMQYLGVAKGLLAVYERPEDFDETFDKDRLQLHFIDIDNYKELLEKINKAVEQFRIDLEKIKENPFITEEELLPNEIVTLSNQVLDLEKALKSYDEIKAKYEKFKEQLRQAMIDKGIKNWETPNKTKITVILDSEDKTIEEEYYDEEKFIKENAELHENYHNKLAEYKKTREVIKKGKKGSLRITSPKKEI